MSKAHALSQERRNLALDRLGDGAISPPCSPKGECRDTHKMNGLKASPNGQPCCITPPD